MVSNLIALRQMAKQRVKWTLNTHQQCHYERFSYNYDYLIENYGVGIQTYKCVVKCIHALRRHCFTSHDDKRSNCIYT